MPAKPKLKAQKKVVTPVPVIATPIPPVYQEPPVENLEQAIAGEVDNATIKRKYQAPFIIGIIGALVLIVASIAVFIVYLQMPKEGESKQSAETVTVTPTPTPEFIRSRFTFEVINASGVSGAAAKGAAALINLGYTVISVGNGDKQAATEIFITKSVDQSTREILQDVGNLFSVASVTGELTGSTASARLILGSK